MAISARWVARCYRGMFIGSEVRATVSTVAATARLACPACGGGVLVRASYGAWEEVRAGIGPAGLPELVQVCSQGPVQRGAVSMLILRWEAADASGQRFPILDADIALVPDGEHATLIGLDGVYRPLPGAGLCPVIAYLVMAAIPPPGTAGKPTVAASLQAGWLSPRRWPHKARQRSTWKY
jgi:hypothetical protein